ncbi:MAG: T9SS type A sorting domain-containing protein, partial [Candidatus Krumholzibacteria bacterium]|nr:T9SS type A sorting domain-containing protein [Candidatus Krumholzibacteria bacterium]
YPRKPFYPGVDVSWDLIAPDRVDPPRIITVRFAAPAATDENSNEPVGYTNSEVPIGVTTTAGMITMQNISHLDTIPPVVVPRGAPGVPVMRVVFSNNSAYTTGLDTLYVSVEDANGNLRSDPSRYVSAISLSSGAEPWSVPVGAVNPVPLVVDHAFELLAGASDTALVSIDVSSAAPDGELRINLAESRDVVFSIGGSGSRISVGRDANGEDIAGFFFNSPLSVMSANFEEYVHNYPNPFRAGSEVTKIAYLLTQDSSVSIKIYDYTGVLVWTKDIPAGGPGGSGEPGGTWWEADWDGRNGNGEVVRNGVYICKVTAGGKSAMFKIAVAK